MGDERNEAKWPTAWTGQPHSQTALSSQKTKVTAGKGSSVVIRTRLRATDHAVSPPHMCTPCNTTIELRVPPSFGAEAHRSHRLVQQTQGSGHVCSFLPSMYPSSDCGASQHRSCGFVRRRGLILAQRMYGKEVRAHAEGKPASLSRIAVPCNRTGPGQESACSGGGGGDGAAPAIAAAGLCLIARYIANEATIHLHNCRTPPWKGKP